MFVKIEVLGTVLGTFNDTRYHLISLQNAQVNLYPIRSLSSHWPIWFINLKKLSDLFMFIKPMVCNGISLLN